jgi:hypothetical protein
MGWVHREPTLPVRTIGVFEVLGSVGCSCRR